MHGSDPHKIYFYISACVEYTLTFMVDMCNSGWHMLSIGEDYALVKSTVKECQR